MLEVRPATQGRFVFHPKDSMVRRVACRRDPSLNNLPGALLLSVGLLIGGTPAMAELSLAEAERIAVERDAVLSQLSNEAGAYRDRAIAGGQLADPQLRFGAINVPVDSFALDAEDMTSLQVGLRQEFPAGDSRQLTRQQMELKASAADAVAMDRRLRVRREVRRQWTELAYFEQARSLLSGEEDWLEQLRRSARARYASGEGKQLDVLQAGLDAAMLRERQLELDRERARHHALLARWLGDAAASSAGPFTLPANAPLDSLSILETRLLSHPAHQDMERRIEAARAGTDLARQRTRPGWRFDVAYGFRDGENRAGESRSDLLSAVVSIDLPLFRSNRQDREVAAAKAEARGLHDMHVDHQRELNALLAEAWEVARQTSELEAFYAGELLPLATQSIEASMLAWRNNRAAIDEVVKARRVALETRLKHLRLSADRAQARYDIDYLAGEQQ